MGKSRWQIIRLSLLAVTFGSSLLVLGKGIFFSNSKPENSVNSFIFPEQVPLPVWEQIKSIPLREKQKNEKLAVYNGQKYIYNQNDYELAIQARYEKYTDSNMGRLLIVYTPIQPGTVQIKLKYKEGIGHYGVFLYDEKIHITACINPQGKTTATEQQFVKNKYLYTLSLKRTLLWAIGQNDLADSSCLWTLLSGPFDSQADETTREATYEKLEAAWFDWHNWWRPRFPPEG
ncbi:MAG: cyanoexosortase A system-associated protein [Gomphosphaeria aponina SAG 52.96 = DSM 107014]|uniref:Cyanoexosortase A system-associated protein n=1 Tax=Gomphosphaeria aponina SAG 52.96 = DSM 107014 TaxID=1521640 RepID=A0A941GUH4_9CHRO|nr:cyanoexosortase A system-associated protein [Gomphosphaeria aponina SAG 52.96 = DSM 107014]